jgi:hypothetical protein
MTQGHRDPAYYRERAEEMRKLADQMSDPEDKRILLNVAEEYETLAKWAEERSAGATKAGPT